MLKKINLQYLRLEFFLILVPIFSFLWHFENNHLPISDAVGYLDSAYTIYSYFHHGEYFNFFISIFNERDWRPVFFQVLIVPFLILSAGNLLIAVLLTHVFFNTLSAIFIFKILSSYIDKFNSLLLALILSLSFNVFFGGESFPLYSEIAFIPFLLASLYYMSEKEFLTSKRNAILFSIFFSLTILIRPVEGILFIIVPLLVLIFEKRKKILSQKEIIKGFLFPSFFLWLLFASRLIPKTSESIIKVDPPASYEIFIILFIFWTFIFAMLFIMYLYKRKEKNNFQKNYLQQILFYSSLTIWVWYTPRFGSLYGWVYQTSIGKQFQYLKNQEYNFNTLFLNIINSNGSIILITFFILLVISIICSIKMKKCSLNNLKIYLKDIKNFVSVFILSTLIPLILYFTTYQVSYRKISPVVLIFLIFLAVLIFKKIHYKKIFSFTILFLLLGQSLFLTNHIYNFHENETWKNKNNNFISNMFLGNGFPHPINSNSNHYDNLIRFMKSFNLHNSGSKIAIVVNDNAYPIEPYLLKFLCKQNSLQCYVNSPKIYIENDYSYLSEYKYILLIDSIEFPLNESNNLAAKIYKHIKANINYLSPGSLYSYQLQYLYSKKLLHAVNMSLKKCNNFHKKNVVCLIENK